MQAAAAAAMVAAAAATKSGANAGEAAALAASKVFKGVEAVASAARKVGWRLWGFRAFSV